MTQQIKRRWFFLKFFSSSLLALLLSACGKNVDKLEDSTGTAQSASGSGSSSGSSTDTSPPTRSWRKIFLTTSTYDGNIGGISGADTICTNDPLKPGVGTYKAMLADASTRTANPTLDWVLKANTEYRALDGVTVIGTTLGTSVFAAPLTNPFGSSAIWTGVNTNWSNTTPATPHCGNWGNNGSGAFGGFGYGSDTSNNGWYAGGTNCNVLNSIVCVEQ